MLICPCGSPWGETNVRLLNFKWGLKCEKKTAIVHTMYYTIIIVLTKFVLNYMEKQHAQHSHSCKAVRQWVENIAVLHCALHLVV